MPDTPDTFSNSNPDLRKARADYIERVWSNLFKLQTDAAEEAKKVVLLVNSGGAVAILGLMGAMKSVDPIPGVSLRVMLACFVGGIIIGVLARAATYYTGSARLSRLRREVDKYMSDAISWPEFIERTTTVPLWAYLIDVFSWLSFFAFIAGAYAAYRGLLA